MTEEQRTVEEPPLTELEIGNLERQLQYIRTGMSVRYGTADKDNAAVYKAVVRLLRERAEDKEEIARLRREVANGAARRQAVEAASGSESGTAGAGAGGGGADPLWSHSE